MTPAPSTNNIEEALAEILLNAKFSASPQMSAFLRYVVTEELNGNGDRIKAYAVGVDALGKPDTFDPQTDPSVRVLAMRLRESLDQFYAKKTDSSTVIVIKSGSYRPLFYQKDEASTAREIASVSAESTNDVASGCNNSMKPIAGGQDSSALSEPPDSNSDAKAAQQSGGSAMSGSERSIISLYCL